MYASEMWPVKVQHDVQSDKTEMSLVRSDGNVTQREILGIGTGQSAWWF